jgi:hypothetical protein
MAIISRYGPVTGCPRRGLSTFRGACLVSASGERFLRKAAVHAQQHLVVDKHELEMESVGD